MSSPSWSRRHFLAASVIGGASKAMGQTPAAVSASGRARGAPDPAAIEARLSDNIYTRLLGVRPHLGAHEHISRLSGSRMPREVIEAMVEANEFFVDMHELGEAAGRRVAEVMGAEAAIVTAGAFSAMVLGAAACLTGTDPEKMAALPHPDWAKKECLVQTPHRFDYDRAYRAAGMVLVEAKTREEFLARIGPNTAMIAVLAAVEKQSEFGPPLPVQRAHPPDPSVMMPDEFIAIGKKTGVPVLVDFASDLPPASNLTRFVRAGADLVVLSGGKGLRGPQSTGILAGRKDLIDAARLNNAPYGNLGRGMKVGKEEIVGLIVALNRYVGLDHAREIEGWNRKARWIAEQLQGIEGLRAEYAVNTMGYADVDLSWDPSIIRLTAEEARQRLRDGEPRVIYDGNTVRTRCLEDGEEVLVARRLKEFFESEAPRRSASTEDAHRPVAGKLPHPDRPPSVLEHVDVLSHDRDSRR